MSIIYDALKKVEEKVDVQQSSAVADIKASQKEKPDFKKMLVYFLVLASGLAAAHFIFTALSYRPAARDLAKPKTSNTASVKPVDMITPVLVQAQVQPEAAAVQPAPESQESAVNEEAVPDLTLNGVFYSDDGGYALINNKIVKQGGSVQGVKLLKIDQDSVEMEYNGAKFKLTSLGR